MRTVLIILGVLALAFGIWVLSGKASYRSDETLVKIGSAELTATSDKPVPQWLGIAGVVIGGVLVIGGFASGRKR